MFYVGFWQQNQNVHVLLFELTEIVPEHRTSTRD